MSAVERLERFVALSSALTAHSAFQLRGTGQAQAYLAAADNVIGEGPVDTLLDAWERVRGGGGEDPAALHRQIRLEIMADEQLGPIARNVVKMWFVGVWYELPAAWHETFFGTRPRDATFTVSAEAYTEGLLWPTIGANPAGAKAPGYGSWVGPPRIPDIPAY